ncbi:ERG2 family protein [Mycolicibacterium gilvum]|uniref:C-8 sterol isomerase n=1 Tax=Mycolicibacterium gilvum TaxID=1804 RepID=A0A378STL3_9MYCO|nr:ERG2 family protein [Mycolicibacterium gilvum]STZ45438.1 C-8 sterol isomerase [Mycolicibacterium gilvum]
MKDPQAPGKPAPPGDTGQHLYATTRKPLPNNTTRHHTEPTPITTQNPGYKHVDIHKFLLAGQIDSYDLESDDTTPLPPLRPGDRTCLERGHARGLTIHPGSWHLEYGRGAVPTTLPFAMVDTLLVSLEFESVRRSTVEFAKLIRRGRRRHG